MYGVLRTLYSCSYSVLHTFGRVPWDSSVAILMPFGRSRGMEQWPDVDDISYISRASEGREQTGPHVRSNAQMMIRGNCVHVHPPLRCMFPISHTSFGHPPLIRHKTPALSADSLLHSTSTTSTTSTTGVSSRVHTMSQTEQGGAPLKKRSVVSSFIIKYPDDADGSTAKPKVALFRRGDKVSTYRHHLAPISGALRAMIPLRSLPPGGSCRRRPL